ncbi:MAG: hypothetical protein PHY48_11785 [Candidatus Cloacimonetes bacterium]|nr:hypothetical protein [Candidatus Cloacimonadota bacterium]
MKKYLGIVNTNQVNLYNHKFPTQGLVEEFVRIRKTMITHVSHDWTRPIGWSNFRGVFFESDLTALIGETCIAESNEEMSKLKSDALEFDKENIFTMSDNNKTKISSSIGIELSDDAIYIGKAAGFIGIIDKGIVLRKFPELDKLANEDKHNLIPISKLNVLSPGVYQFGELVVFAHKSFRRSGSYLNSLNVEFLETIENVDTGKFEVKIALDFDVIGLTESCERVIELDYWWGPKFSNDLTSIEYGITKHGASQEQKEYFNLRSTELGWHEQDNKHCFECEELLDENIFPYGDLFYMRYAHSLIDPLTKTPMHLDGAIRGYSMDNYLCRIDEDNSMDKAEKADDYVKLWRIDGAIDFELWKELICHYYRDNHLPGEYFGGIDINTSKTQQEPEVEAYDGKTTSKFLKVMVSITPLNTFVNDGNIVIYPFKSKRDEVSPSISYIEFEAIHIIKRLINLDAKFSYSDNAFTFITFSDDSINFPTIVVNLPGGSISPSDLTTQIHDTINYYQSRNNPNGKNPQIVSFEIAVRVKDEYHVYSCMGDSSSMLEFISSNILSFALCRSSLKTTLIDIHEFLKKKHDVSSYIFAPLRYRGNSCIECSFDGNRQLLQLDCAIGTKVVEAICPSCHNNYCNCSCDQTQINDAEDIIISGEGITIKEQWN